MSLHPSLVSSRRPGSPLKSFGLVLLAIGLACFGANALAQVLNDPGDPKENAEAIKRATGFLALIDKGKLAETWLQTGPILRSMTTRPDWESTLRGVRASAGAMKHRAVPVAGFTAKIDGAPDGHYYAVFFTTEFANGKVEEKVILNLAKGRWVVEGYFFTPMDSSKR